MLHLSFFKMSATILESLSNRKLISIISGLLFVQLLAFYVGAFRTPSPTGIQHIIATKCIKEDMSALAVPRYYQDVDNKFIRKNCLEKNDTITHNANEKFQPTTFAIQLPIPRNNEDLVYTRWMQTLLVMLSLDVKLLMSSGRPTIQPEYTFSILINADLAVKNVEDKDWTLHAQRKNLKRIIHCQVHDFQGVQELDCDHIQLFELQSLHYEYYLINFEITEDPTDSASTYYPLKLDGVKGVAIHHNGGFTQIWLALKTLYFLVTLTTLIWYSKRLNMLNRKTILIERILSGLGSVLTILNVPIEYLTLFFDLPFMTFLNDLRQGLFYCALFSFWIIFFGEHLQDGTRKGRNLANYSRELMAIIVASTSLFIFDLSERGIQTLDPFLTKPKLANVAIYIAMCASLAYISYLAYYIYLAYRTISGRETFLPKMQITKRLRYQGIIYRFKFLLWATVVCAMSTFIFYAYSQRDDDESPIEWTSAMLVTVSSMWNIYVIMLLILYAPSHKGIIAGVGMNEQIEFDCLTEDREEESTEGDMKLLQELANKASME